MLIDFGRCATVSGGQARFGGGVRNESVSQATAGTMLPLPVWGWDETACRELALDAELPDRIATGEEERLPGHGTPGEAHNSHSVLQGPAPTIGECQQVACALSLPFCQPSGY